MSMPILWALIRPDGQVKSLHASADSAIAIKYKQPAYRLHSVRQATAAETRAWLNKESK